MNRVEPPILGIIFTVTLSVLAIGRSDARRFQAGGGPREHIRVDGSSPVYPITEAVAEEFQADHPDVQVTVAISGTGGGFKKFCVGEADISDASRPIKASELQLCRENDVEPIELLMGLEGVPPSRS